MARKLPKLVFWEVFTSASSPNSGGQINALVNGLSGRAYRFLAKNYFLYFFDGFHLEGFTRYKAYNGKTLRNEKPTKSTKNKISAKN